MKEVQAAAHTLGRQLRVVLASSESDIDAAFVTLREMRAGGLAIVGNPLFNNRRSQLIELAARHRIPTIQESRESTLAGGLMSYGTNVPDVYLKIGGYAAQSLERREASGLAGSAADQIRHGYQPQDR